MIRYTDLKTGRETTGSPFIAALGNFDGVHIGHAAVIRETVDAAKRNDVKSAVWFFRDRPAGGAKMLTSTDEKCAIFSSLGADLSITEDFSDVKDLSPEEFVEDYLVGEGCRGIVCGFNFRFGKGAAGDTALLKDLCERLGLFFRCADPVSVDGVTVSSTEIRKRISDGDVELAAKMLGRPYSYSAPVDHGRALGAKFGFPTINQYFEDCRAVPRRGVYYTYTKLGEELLPSVSNVGSRPTVGGHVCRLETHILGYSGDLYGKSPEVYFIKFRRPETKFESEDQLIAAVEADKLAASEFFSAAAKEKLEGKYR